jgi:hypothetical protein
MSANAGAATLISPIYNGNENPILILKQKRHFFNELKSYFYQTRKSGNALANDLAFKRIYGQQDH